MQTSKDTFRAEPTTITDNPAIQTSEPITTDVQAITSSMSDFPHNLRSTEGETIDSTPSSGYPATKLTFAHSHKESSTAGASTTHYRRESTTAEHQTSGLTTSTSDFRTVSNRTDSYRTAGVTTDYYPAGNETVLILFPNASSTGDGREKTEDHTDQFQITPDVTRTMGFTSQDPLSTEVSLNSTEGEQDSLADAFMLLLEHQIGFNTVNSILCHVIMQRHRKYCLHWCIGLLTLLMFYRFCCIIPSLENMYMYVCIGNSV